MWALCRYERPHELCFLKSTTQSPILLCTHCSRHTHSGKSNDPKSDFDEVPRRGSCATIHTRSLSNGDPGGGVFNIRIAYIILLRRRENVVSVTRSRFGPKSDKPCRHVPHIAEIGRKPVPDTSRLNDLAKTLEFRWLDVFWRNELLD